MDQEADASEFGEAPRQPADLEPVHRQVAGFDYEITDHGDVFSLPRVVIRSNGRPYTCVRKRLKPWFNGGHLQVELHRDGETVYRYVHVLVLEAFVGPRPSSDHKGLHRDDDPWHNHVSNLYWGTMSDNALDRVRNGNDVNARKVECKRGHVLAGPNLAPWGDTYNQRICWACNKALVAANQRGRRGDEAYIQALSDEKYAALMGQREVMSL